VAISRAKEGLYIFGNAEDLSSKSRMWRSIIEELDSYGCVGEELPIVCHQHPETVEYVSEPGVLPQIAPDGKSFISVDAFIPQMGIFKGVV
jgi:hypothetical protein